MWYNRNMSKLTQNKENDISETEFETPVQNYKVQNKEKDINSELDISLVMSCFQEKVGQLTTENIIKDAKIKQLITIINQMKGQGQ